MDSIKNQNSKYDREGLIKAARKVGAIINAAEEKQRDYELQRAIKQISIT